MNRILEINNSVVFVQGARNGAIYNFLDGDIYSINAESCEVIRKLYSAKQLSCDEEEYAKLLISKRLLVASRTIKEYVPQRKKEQLNLCWLEVTQQCNCRCLHCYEGIDHGKKNNSLSLDEWKAIVDQLKDLNVGRVVVIGGEPCTHPNISAILEYIARSKIDTTLFTNGTLIDESIKNTVIKNGIKMKFSLYGHCADVHDRITNRRGSFQSLLDSIHYFVDRKVEVDIAIVLMHENEYYYEEILKFANSLNVKNYRADVIREVLGGTQGKHLPQRKEVAEIVKRKLAHFAKITKNKFDHAQYFNTCWSGKIVVTEDGNVLPCVFERKQILGNVRNKSLKDIIDYDCTACCWEYDYSHVTSCRNCEFRFACKDCRPLAKAATGRIDGKNPRCGYDVQNGVWT